MAGLGGPSSRSCSSSGWQVAYSPLFHLYPYCRTLSPSPHFQNLPHSSHASCFHSVQSGNESSIFSIGNPSVKLKEADESRRIISNAQLEYGRATNFQNWWINQSLIRDRFPRYSRGSSTTRLMFVAYYYSKTGDFKNFRPSPNTWNIGGIMRGGTRPPRPIHPLFRYTGVALADATPAAAVRSSGPVDGTIIAVGRKRMMESDKDIESRAGMAARRWWIWCEWFREIRVLSSTFGHSNEPGLLGTSCFVERAEAVNASSMSIQIVLGFRVRNQ